MRRFASGALCAALVAFGWGVQGSPVASLDISGSRLKGTKSCSGGTATIAGNDNQLTLKKCSKVTVLGNRNKLKLTGTAALVVKGNRNRVAAGLVKSISTIGNRNVVTYKLGPKKKKPRISNLGKGNKIRPE